jgi:ribosomal protein S18 acetylase RimI-like enzyme
MSLISSMQLASMIYILLLSQLVSAASAILITPPTSASDYKRIAALLVSTFDSPDELQSSYNANQPSVQDKWGQFQWNLYERVFTEDFTYRQYVSTARRMRNKKYCLLVAKDDTVIDSSNENEVVGMIEMGMSICPTLVDTNCKNRSFANDNISSPQPTIGVLCTKSTRQKQGIGRALVQKCEQIALEVWKEDHIFADVEPNNLKSLAFFENCGYKNVLDEFGMVQIRNTTVFRRRVQEVKPHLLLQKSL